MPAERAIGTIDAPALPLVDLGLQHAQLRVELDQAVDRVFASSDFILGAEVNAFEAEFADYCGSGQAIACGNGTDALELALWGVGVNPGDEVVTVAHTFAATGEAIARCGAVPRFVDVASDSLLMDLDQVEAAITARTRAIVPVHLYGNCVDMEALTDLAARRGVKVVEDAAQAHGAMIGGRRAGAWGDAGCFSFYPGKNLGACGDAGAIVTSDADLSRRLRQARDHGRSSKYEHEFVGRNSRMDGLQAAILRVKLPHLEAWNSRRRELASRYRHLLEDVPGVELVATGQHCAPVYHLFVVRSRDRDRIRQFLESVGIATGIHYPIPLHLQPAFAELSGPSPRSLPESESAAGTVVSLPMFPEMNEADVDRVMEALGAALQAPMSRASC